MRNYLVALRATLFIFTFATLFIFTFATLSRRILSFWASARFRLALVKFVGLTALRAALFLFYSFFE